jgi:hypothetical protein
MTGEETYYFGVGWIAFKVYRKLKKAILIRPSPPHALGSAAPDV